ncbi:hypothetical protein ABW19_dt0207486 [Dactylella cylindrospora]|nr:hypothetical protein ABW19_dt0207486 [Dactylella cylindrospora]
MSVKSFGRAFRNRRPSIADVSGLKSPASALGSRRPAACCCQLGLDSSDGIPNRSPICSPRTFSTSSPLSKGSKQARRERQLAKTPLPFFPRTGNQPLDTLLQSIHRDQFTIDHLPEHYHRLVTRTTRHHVLAEQAAQQAFARGITNPSNATLTVTIDNQSIPLKPIASRTLHGSKDLTTILNTIQSPAEYDVLPQLVQGMAYSGIEISPGQWRKLVRSCGLAGRPGVAIKIAHEGVLHRKNGFSYTLGTIREMMRAQFVRFLLPEKKYATEAVRRAKAAAASAKGLKDWYDNDQIRQRKTGRAPEWLHVDPVVRGTILFLEAGKSVRWSEGTDESGGVVKAVKDLMTCWESAREEILSTTERIELAIRNQGGKDKSAEKDYVIARDALQDWEPVLQGLKWTQQVLDNVAPRNGEIDRWLPQASTTLRNATEKWRPVAESKGSGKVGMGIYEAGYEKLDAWLERNRGKEVGKLVEEDKIHLVEKEES